MIDWQDVKYAPPKTFVLVRGPSGATTTPEFIAVAFYDDDFRKAPSTGERVWLDIHNDPLTDQSWAPTHWAPLPMLRAPEPA